MSYLLSNVSGGLSGIEEEMKALNLAERFKDAENIARGAIASNDVLAPQGREILRFLTLEAPKKLQEAQEATFLGSRILRQLSDTLESLFKPFRARSNEELQILSEIGQGVRRPDATPIPGAAPGKPLGDDAKGKPTDPTLLVVGGLVVGLGLLALMRR